MTDTQTIEAINRHLDAEPTDWTARLELADLLEDAGREDEADESRYQRWAVRHQRAPMRIPNSPTLWQWVNTSHVKTEHQSVILRLYWKLNTWSADWGYSSRQEAEADLMRVLIAQAWPAPTRG